MEVTITQKCDRSGRTIEKKIDSSEISTFESRQARREETLKKIEEFFAGLPKDVIPDLIAVYRGEMRHFINVEATFCDKPVSRLLDQLFHVSDPSDRVAKAKASKAAKKAAKTAKAKGNSGSKDDKDKKDKKGAKGATSKVQGDTPSAG